MTTLLGEEPQRSRNGNGMSLGTFLTIASIASLFAGVGYNFRLVTETQEWQKRNDTEQKRYDSEYVRRDVQEQQLRQIDYKLESLRGEIGELKVLVRAKGR